MTRDGPPPVGARPRARGRPDGFPILSVVVPTLDEVEHLPALLSDLASLDAEVIVADGRSSDGTQDVACAHGAWLLTTPPGRGRQLRAGAAAASGDWLFFVHADCRLSSAGFTALERFLATAGARDFAHFGFELDRDRWIHRFIEFGQRLRERFLGLPYGDQGLVVSRALYREAGGYPDWPIMEDVGLLRRLMDVGGRRVALPAALVTSARRYDEEGGLRRWARNVLLMARFGLGASPEKLARWYGPRRVGGGGELATGGATRLEDDRTLRRVVGVFAKAPTPGRVKTRLAAAIGNERATRIYRAMGRATVDALRGGPYRLVVFFAPPDSEARDLVGSWLGVEGLELLPQAEGDLGERMSAALGEALRGAEAALLVGTDIPGIDRTTVGDAFAALDHRDVVLGPATDGGYYLIGMKRPEPELFENVAWSTSSVLASTLERARSEGLSVALLDEKSDVDTVADLPGPARTPR